MTPFPTILARLPRLAAAGVLAALVTLCAFVACGLAPSHAPLGGNYSVPEAASAGERKPRAALAPTPSEEGNPTAEEPEQPTPAVVLAASADAGAAQPSSDTLHYEPFQAGDQIRAEVSIAFLAEVRGGPRGAVGGDSKLRLDAKMHVDLKILRASAQSLDELELTLTPISLHTEFGGRSSNGKQDPPETYDITLSGQSPSVRSHGGSPLSSEERAALTLLVTPLLEFHDHWARSPTLLLKPGWSSKVPVATPAFMAAPGDTVHVGPFSASYSGGDPKSPSVPFEVSLPIEYGNDAGKLTFDLGGKALLSSGKGRPVSIDLSGPLGGTAGASGSQATFRGTAKFGATLKY